MDITRRIAAAAAGTALVATPLVVLAASPAQADVERHGTCGRGTYELNVDRERSGYEVSFELDRVAVGSTWKVKLLHDGKRVAHKVQKANHEGEVDLERNRPDTRGSDTFRTVAVNADTGLRCAATITMR